MRNDWSGQHFPHPPGRRPVVGDVLGADPAQPLQSTMRRAGGLGPIFELHVFDQKFVFVSSAELAAELADESRFQKALSPALVALREFAGAGLFTAYNDETDWALAHDLLRPAFTRDSMRGYHPIMLAAAQELFDSWDAGTGPVDVAADMTRLTMETISRTAFSHDFGSFSRAEPHPFIPAMIAALRAGQRKGSLNAMPGSALMARRIDKRNAHHQAYVDRLLDDIIAERRAEGAAKKDDLLGIMLDTPHPQTGEKLDDLNIRHQILTFLVAGHETTSGALSFALYYLSRNPALMATAHEEVDRILGPDRDAEPTFEQVPKFRYLRRVLDEGLRLWPTAPAFARSPRATTTLSTGHVMRPQDWALVMLPMVHRDPAVWGPDADEFDPDRFSPERSRGRVAHSYKPFGTGERSCIGRQFALHEAILVLARVLRRYDLTPDPGYELRITERLTLMPEGFELWLSPRR
ncbi:cytochrome P450 [Aeromicrobium wangtongii]|uniref:Cytochrome P450 n=1 Tax=Aeromicrobium wangtongii TaxID=2969247 RepID=A0ABY5MBS8_9ACTN|nr:cytochrome P450 [Aeromicrobium wangtongii]MCD9196919.1 cytochrome P450 [Aeromicrobium wangtongii]UUP14425.1 cytochrome P450 [Aeromicrobium wangtongii]